MTNTPHNEREHATFSASGAERWIGCPGSVQLEREVEERYGKEESSTQADEGTKAHEVAEALLTDRPVECDDKEMLGHCKDYADYVLNLAGIDGDVLTEQRVYYGKEIMQPDTEAFGTCDNIAYVEVDGAKQLHVIDFKYGFGEVKAENNYQLMLYALGAIGHKLFTLRDIDEIYLHIFQPRINNIDMWKCRWQELLSFRTLAANSAKEACGPNPEFFPSEKSCRWCSAKAHCKALEEDMFAEFSAQEEKTVDDIDLLRLSEVIRKKSFITDYIKAAEKRAFNIVDSGGSIPRMKAVKKISKAKWKPDVEPKLVEKLGDGAFQEPKLITITEARKILTASDIVDLTDRDAKGFDVVPEEDRRKAIKVEDLKTASEDDFSDFDVFD